MMLWSKCFLFLFFFGIFWYFFEYCFVRHFINNFFLPFLQLSYNFLSDAKCRQTTGKWGQHHFTNGVGSNGMWPHCAVEPPANTKGCCRCTAAKLGPGCTQIDVLTPSQFVVDGLHGAVWSRVATCVKSKQDTCWRDDYSGVNFACLKKRVVTDKEDAMIGEGNPFEVKELTDAEKKASLNHPLPSPTSEQNGGQTAGHYYSNMYQMHLPWSESHPRRIRLGGASFLIGPSETGNWEDSFPKHTADGHDRNVIGDKLCVGFKGLTEENENGKNFIQY